MCHDSLWKEMQMHRQAGRQNLGLGFQHCTAHLGCRQMLLETKPSKRLVGCLAVCSCTAVQIWALHHCCASAEGSNGFAFMAVEGKVPCFRDTLHPPASLQNFSDICLIRDFGAINVIFSSSEWRSDILLPIKINFYSNLFLLKKEQVWRKDSKVEK